MKKKTLLFLITLLAGAAATAQNIIPNAGFENWDSATCFAPTFSVQTSNPPLFFANYDSFNCQRVMDAFHGSYAIKLTTVLTAQGDTAPGFFINGNANNDPATWTGGIPIAGIPVGASGYFKSAIAGNDSGLVVFDFRSGGVSVGVYSYKFAGTQAAYTPFSFTFNPPISVTPDTVIFGASSSDFIDHKMVAGSMLQLDDISLTGLFVQPDQLNGDFELWDSTTLLKPNSWYDQSNNLFAGIARTTDAEVGTYATELKTVAGRRNNQPEAISAILSNGFYECPEGKGHCPLEGGSPYTGLIDTLAFNYKYLPSGNDTAQVFLIFKKNGIKIGGTSPVILFQSNNYREVEIPFVLGQSPDTAVVTFQSSLFGDSLLSFVGSDLKIDNIHFKDKVTIPSGIKQVSSEKELLIYPNPSSNGAFTVSGLTAGEQVRVFNILGEEINIGVITKTSSSSTIQLPANAGGIYFVQVFSKDEVITCKVTLNRN